MHVCKQDTDHEHPQRYATKNRQTSIKIWTDYFFLLFSSFRKRLCINEINKYKISIILRYCDCEILVWQKPCATLHVWLTNASCLIYKAHKGLVCATIWVRFSVRCYELSDKAFLCPSSFCLPLKYTYLDINSVSAVSWYLWFCFIFLNRSHEQIKFGHIRRLQTKTTLWFQCYLYSWIQRQTSLHLCL